MSKIENNTIRLNILIDQINDILDVEVDYNLSSTMSDDQQEYYLDVVNGIISKCKNEVGVFAKEGYFIRELNKLRLFADEIVNNEEEEFSIEFEPSEELVEAVSENKNGKIIKFNTKKVH
tara:strand:+ start:7355 stop:7714 length:360 start_codon:yes stop_codon:yes gene_type:complete